MITPIDIALLGVVLAAVALVILRRRRSGTTDAAVSPAAHRGAPTASGDAGWAETAATLAPVREPEAAPAPDDGWEEIITDPGWYLPGETEMSWQIPAAETGPLVPGSEAVIGSAPLLGEGADVAYPELDAGESWLEPATERWGLDERETIVAPAPGPPETVPSADDAGPAPSIPPPVQEIPRRLPGGNRRRRLLAGAGVGVLGILLAAVVGWNAMTAEPPSRAPAPAAAPAAAGARARVSAPARSEVVASLRRVDAAADRDDPAAARRILGSIDPGVLRADAALAARARILRHRVGLTEGYLAATALAGAGRYAEARQRMLALVPFRDAGVRARLDGVEVAKDLVARARAAASARPGRALALLNRAEEIAPSLSAIRAARAGVAG